MNITKTTWPNNGIDGHSTDALGTCGYDSEMYQPGFGIGIGWNVPRQWWKPFIRVEVWHYTIQFGWLL